MGLNGSLSGITFGGLASGIDTDGIIDRLTSIERIPAQRMQQQQAQLRQKAEVYSSLKTQISGISQAVNSLNIVGTFNPVSSTTSNKDVATIATTTGAQPGTYNVKVSRLAQAQKLGSAAQASTTVALGQTGSFIVNGKSVTVEATDSLKSIATKVNDLGVGVTASLIDGGANNAFLTFTSSASGVAGKPQIADTNGSVLASIGVLGGADSVRNPITFGAAGQAFTKSDQSIGSLMGVTGLTPQTVQINGVGVSIDLQNDSLQAVADKINGAGTGASASVVPITEGTTTKFRLEIKGTTATPTFTDSGSALKTLGILQPGAGNELIAAQDAAYSIDGINLTSSTNTIKDVIPGGSITLLKANATTPEETNLTLTSDADSVTSKVKEIANAFNETIGFIKANSSFNADNYQTGPLFGDNLAIQFENTVATTLFNTVPGITGDYKNLSAIGFKLNSEGNMELDESKFKTAFATDPESVRKLFQSFGTSTNPSVSYVSSTSTTLPSATSPYNIDITQLATKSTWLSATAKTSPNTVSEKLTFGGSLFGGSSIDLTVDIGSDLDTIVAKINSDPRLKDYLGAANVGGFLEVSGKKFGANGGFTLVSNQSPSGSNSGVGFAPGTYNVGLDVQGTIAGQAATGNGQFLTAAPTNTAAAGLQIQYTGLTTGPQGSMNYIRGLNGIANEMLKSFTDATNGLAVTSEKSVRDQADSLQKDIDAVNERADRKAFELRSRFADMEQRIGLLQSQGSRLSQFTSQNQAQ